MKIKIPNYKVPSWNQFYAGKHWAVRKKMADEAHELVGAYAAGEMFEDPVDITITAHYKHKRRRDSDNVCSKILIDGLCGKVIEEDDTEYVKKVTTQAVIGAKSDFVEIEIYPHEE